MAMAMLVGIVLLAHQIGGFMVAYLGGTGRRVSGHHRQLWLSLVHRHRVGCRCRTGQPANPWSATGARHRL